MKKIAGIACLMLAVVPSTVLADDSAWMQQKSVAIGSAKFQECVTTAVTGVSGVSIDRAASASAEKVVLDVKMVKPIPFLDVEVQHRGGNAVILFIGRGASQPEADRKAITPVLQSIADAIGAKCGAAKK